MTTNDPSVLQGYGCMVTVVVPAKDAQDVIKRALNSVRAQTFQNWEAIVVDDSSSDDTFRLAQSIAADDQRFTVLKNKTGQGAAHARNVALNVAQGRFIAFLDADDEWHPDKLIRQLTHMQENEAVLGYTGFVRSRATHSRRVHVPEVVSYEGLLRGNCIGCLTAMYDRDALGDIPMPDLTMRQDYALWLDILSGGAVAYGLDEPLATYHKTPKSLSANKIKAMIATWRLYRDYLGLGPMKATRYLVSHLARRAWRG